VATGVKCIPQLKKYDIDFNDIDQNDPSFKQLCQNLLNAKIRAIETYKAKIEGKAPPDNFDTATDASVDTSPSHNEANVEIIIRHPSDPTSCSRCMLNIFISMR
jgi:hypothetical protein